MKLTKKRRANLSRFFFNLAQIIFTMYIAGRILSPEKITLLNFWIGIFWFLILAGAGYLMENGEEK